MRLVKASAFALLVGAGAAGCKSNSEPPPSPEPSAGTMTAPADSPSAMTPAPTTRPAVTTAAPTGPEAAPAEKDMTHLVAKDAPYFTSTPAAGKAPSGTLKAGTKVVVMMPRGGYSQVLTGDGKRVYTSTAGLQPLGK